MSLPKISKKNFVLEQDQGRVQLRKTDEPKLGPVYVDFVSGSVHHRRKYGGGLRQALARAVGLKKKTMFNIVDATAGLGGDAFVLAALGCRVHLIERSPVIFALLEDGIKRAQKDPDIGEWVRTRMTYVCQESKTGLKKLPFVPDVVYLDPMFPEKKKVALVKKNMQTLKYFLKADDDADQLLSVALKVAQKRVVVKRPAYAKPLAEHVPDATIKTVKNRFDIYFKT